MPDSKISALTAALTLADTDEFVIATGGATKKATFAKLRWPRAYKTGAYYITNQSPAGDLAVTPVLDKVTYHPFPVGGERTFDRITCGVQTVGAAGSVVRLGIYESTNGEPDTRLLDAGTVAGDTTGYKEITISQALSANTLYWIAVVAQVAAVPILRAGAVGSGADWMGQETNNSDPRACCFTQTGVTGALPATATPINMSSPNQVASVKVRAA